MMTNTETQTQYLADGRDITATLCWAEHLADTFIRTCDRKACDEAGRAMVARIANPANAAMASGLAAILEKFRADYRVAFASVQPQLPQLTPAQVALRELPQGTFTIEFSDGDYRTIEIETQTEGSFAGKTIVSYLSGPDNERDFQGFAFVNYRADGLPTIATWRRFAGIDERWRMAAYIAATSNRDDLLGMAELYAQRSGRCARCGRKLTVPASLHRGYGPDCAAQVGLA